MARGTHGRQGPPPDPNALRRDRKTDKAGWVVLPAEGRPGPTPAWPLANPIERELDVWEALWMLPQAVEWERASQWFEVGLHVRSLVAAESAKATAAERTLVRQQQEALGISQPGLARNRWRIGEDVVGAAAATPAPTPTSARTRRQTTSARDRLRVVKSA